MNGPTVPTYSVNNPLTGPSVPSYTNPVGASSVPSYGGQVVSSAPSSTVNKGPLGQKYPQTTTGYTGAASGYSGNTYNPLDYSAQPVQPSYGYG